jgi:alpha-D-xyloside xylohydrolase
MYDDISCFALLLDKLVLTIYWYRDGGLDNGPHFKLNNSHPEVKVTPNAKSLDYESGPLKLSLNTTPNEFGVQFTTGKDGAKVTSHSFRSIGYFRDATSEVSRFEDQHFMQTKGYMLAGLDISIGEKLYGLGERFGPLIKNGQSVDINNEDGGTETEHAYKNVPFYLSSKGYGVLINTPAKVSLELQSERTTRVNISVPEEKLQYYIIYGPSPKEVIDKYTALTGRPSMPPAWSYGLWLTPSFITNWTRQIVTEHLDGLKERGITLGVFHFDAAWMKGHQVCSSFRRYCFFQAAATKLRTSSGVTLTGIQICSLTPLSF